MKSFFIKLTPILLIIFVSMAMVTKAVIAEKVVGQLPEADLTLYATEKEGNLTDFKMKVKGYTYNFSRWVNVANPTYYPALYYNDTDNDGNNEITIVLTTGTGSDVILQEVHVFNVENDGEKFNEILVDNPMAIINKNVKSKMTNSEAIINISGGKTTEINIKELGIDPTHLFPSLNFGSKLKYKVVNNKLMAMVGVSIAPSPLGYLGEIHISYTFKNNMYQAEQINFVPVSKLE